MAQTTTPEEQTAAEKPAEKTELSAAELKDLLQRTQANLENYRKQTEKRFEEIKDKAAKEIILNLLPILDNFDLALSITSAKPEDLLKGIELIYAQLANLLEMQGVKVIATAGQSFNPYQHEALLKVESEQPAGRILEVFQKGFTLQGEVIRPAKVKVSAGPKTEQRAEKRNEQHSTINNKN